MAIERNRALLVLLIPLLLAVSAPVHCQELFAAPRIYLDGRQMVLAADIDGDGDQDVLRALSPTGLQFVWDFNDGNGRFAPGPIFGIAEISPRRTMAVLEVTGDGILDLVVATIDVATSTNQLRVYAGDGLGGALSVTNYGLPSEILHFAVGDGDADGRDDLLLRIAGPQGAATSTELLWALKLPGGGFSFGPQFPTLSTPFSGREFETDDLNGDGRADLLLINGLMTPIRVDSFFTQPGGVIVAGPSTAILGPFLAPNAELLMADLNGNGVQDAFVAQPSIGPFDFNLVTLINSGTGVLAAGPLQTIPLVHPWAPDFFVADIDQDGDDDLMVRGIAAAIFGVLPGGHNICENAGGGSFSLAWSWSTSQGESGGPGFADINNDGVLDFLGASDSFFGNGTFQPFAEELPTITEGRFFDHDGDGDPDLVVDRSLEAFRNNGTGALLTTSGLRQGFPMQAPGFELSDPYWIDWDGDGDEDVIASLNTQGVPSGFVQHEMFRNDGGATLVAAGTLLQNPATFLDFYANNLGLGWFPRMRPERQMRDFNGDGRLDFVLADTIYLQLANGRFATPPTPTTPNWRAIDSTDFDGDGDIDLLAIPTNASNSQLALLLNNGAGSFTVQVLPLVGAVPRTAVFADVDGDGAEDIVAEIGATGTSGLQVWPNAAGTIGVPIVAGLPAAQRLRRLQVADFDLDGRMDVLVSDEGGTALGSHRTIVLRQSAVPFVFDPPMFFAARGVLEAVDLDGDGDLDLGGRNNIMNETIRGPGSGNRRQFGTGVTGSFGILPLLGATGPFRVGETGVLRLSGVLGGTAAVIAFGPQESNMPLPTFPGAFAYSAPWSLLLPLTTPGANGVSGAGDLSMSATFPPSAANSALYIQAAFVDPGTPLGISVTPGLELIIGP